MQAVLLDPAIRASAAGPLATESPSALVHRDGCELVLPTGFAETPRRGDAGHAGAENRDAWEPSGQRGAITRARAASSSVVVALSSNAPIACSRSGTASSPNRS